MTCHLLAITPGLGFDPRRWEPVLASGIDALLIREPDLGRAHLEAAATWCRGEHPEVALWIRSHQLPGCGLHLPEGMEGGGRGVSRPLHDPGQWEARSRAAQLLISPICPTPGKGEAWGVGKLHTFLEALPEGGPRLLALGGLTPTHVRAVRHPRLQGLAAIRPFWQGEAREAVEAFREAWG